MFNYTDVKMMFDWGCFTTKQVREFVPDCITEAQFERITGEAFQAYFFSLVFGRGFSILRKGGTNW